MQKCDADILKICWPDNVIKGPVRKENKGTKKIYRIQLKMLCSLDPLQIDVHFHYLIFLINIETFRFAVHILLFIAMQITSGTYLLLICPSLCFIGQSVLLHKFARILWILLSANKFKKMAYVAWCNLCWIRKS